MALGWIVHAPWAVGPLLGALTVFLAWDCGRMLYGLRGGALSAAFLACNPWWPLMSAGFMNHTSTLFFLALSFDCGLRALRSGSALVAFAGGLALGWAAATRPLTAVAFGALPAVVFLYGWARRRRPSLAQIACAACGFGLWIVLFMFYNWGTTGDPLVTAYQRNAGALVVPGFHGGSGHTPQQGLINTIVNFAFFRHWGPVAGPGFYLPLAWLLLFAPIGGRERFLAGQWLAMGLAYFIYYWQDLALGPRLLYESIFPYSLLAAGSLICAVKRLERFLATRERRRVRLRRALTWTAAGLCLWSVSEVLPHAEKLAVRCGGRRAFVRAAHAVVKDNPRAVVFVNAPEHELFVLEMARHPDGPLYLNHLSDELNRRFMAAHPGRKYYYLDESGFVEYPLTPTARVLTKKRVEWLPGRESSEQMRHLFHVPGGRAIR